jgi:hypothetical protein
VRRAHLGKLVIAAWGCRGVRRWGHPKRCWALSGLPVVRPGGRMGWVTSWSLNHNQIQEFWLSICPLASGQDRHCNLAWLALQPVVAAGRRWMTQIVTWALSSPQQIGQWRKRLSNLPQGFLRNSSLAKSEGNACDDILRGHPTSTVGLNQLGPFQGGLGSRLWDQSDSDVLSDAV